MSAFVIDLPRELIESAVERGITVRPPSPDVSPYYVFLDWASGSGSDSFGAAIAHAEAGGRVVLDAILERRPPFDPAGVCVEVRDLMAMYRSTIAVGDRYAAGFVISALAKVGVTYQHSTRDRSEIYLSAAPLFSAGLVRLLDHDRLVDQLASLERRSGSAGRDKVDAIRGRSEDVANAACGAIALAAQQPTALAFPNLDYGELTERRDPIFGTPRCGGPDGLTTANPLASVYWENRE